MSFNVSIKNVPEYAEYWLVAIYVYDPATGTEISYYSNYLAIEESWRCPLYADEGIKVDARFIIYDSDKDKIGQKDLHDITVRDDKEFVYNWAGSGINPWVVATGVLGLTVVGLALAGRRR